jgi:hypothetical protein
MGSVLRLSPQPLQSDTLQVDSIRVELEDTYLVSAAELVGVWRKPHHSGIRNTKCPGKRVEHRGKKKTNNTSSL